MSPNHNQGNPGTERRVEQPLTKKMIRRGPLIKRIEHRRPRPQQALAQIQPIYPALGPRHRLKEGWRTLIHVLDLKAATARLARWQLEPRFTNGYIEGCHTKIKSQKRRNYGLRNRDRCRRKMLRSFRPPIQSPQGLT